MNGIIVHDVNYMYAFDCLINESGGTFKTINDKKIIYNQKKTLVTDTIIASNSTLFEGVSDLLF